MSNLELPKMSSTLFKPTFENKLINPTNFYTTPEKVLCDLTLNKRQKKQILQKWEFDARKLDVAEDENMIGGPRSFLENVLQASNALNS